MIPKARRDRLPDEYQEVEWLRGTGTQYCNTAFNAYNDGNKFISMRGDLVALNINSEINIIGASSGTSYYGIDVAKYTYGMNCQLGVSPNNIYTLGIQGTANFNIHYEINQTECIINGHIFEVNWPTFYMSRYISIGKIVPASRICNRNVLIKTISIYENDTLISEIIPCFRKSDGVAGFYQTYVPESPTNFNFITNLGTGDDWLIGPEV